MNRDNIIKLNNILNKFLEDNGIECTADIDTDFNYSYSKSIAYYALVVPDRISKLFNSFFEVVSYGIEADIFLTSWLHEVGHNETMDLISEEDYQYSEERKKELTSSDEDCLLYFNLPIEIAATNWAIKFIKENTDAVAALWKEIQPIIMQIYEDNSVER